MKLLFVLPSFVVVFAAVGWLVGTILAEILVPARLGGTDTRLLVFDEFTGSGIAVGVLVGIAAGIGFTMSWSMHEERVDRLERSQRRAERGLGDPNFEDFDDGLDEPLVELEVVSLIETTDEPPIEAEIVPDPRGSTASHSPESKDDKPS